MKNLFTVVMLLVSSAVAFASSNTDARANQIISECNARGSQRNILVCKFLTAQKLRDLNIDVQKQILVENNKDGNYDSIVETTRKISLLRDNSTDISGASGMAFVAINEGSFAKANADADQSIRVLLSNLEDAKEDLAELRN